MAERYHDSDGEIAAALRQHHGRDVDPGDVFLARYDMNLDFPFPSTKLRSILAAIDRMHLPKHPQARALAKAREQSYRDAERRCRENEKRARQARAEVLGSEEPPFSDLIAAREWIEQQRRKMGPVHVTEMRGPGALARSCEVLAWPGESGWVECCPVDKDGPLARLAVWSKLFAGGTSVDEAQATSYILTGEIGGDPGPIRVAVAFHRNRGFVVTVTADAYVPQEVVARIWGRAAKEMTGQSRSRPRPKRGR